VVTDQFWQRVEPLVPQRVPSPDKQYVRKPGAGRPPKPARQVFEGIVYVLRTGCQWKALPAERFGSASAVHKRFLEWEKAGFFESLWKAGLAEYDDMEAPRASSHHDSVRSHWLGSQNAVSMRSVGKPLACHPRRPRSTTAAAFSRRSDVIHLQSRPCKTPRTRMNTSDLG
jgi:transposase